MKPGDRVRMAESIKAKLGGKCREAGKHLGPFDPEDAEDCWGCSWEHVKEFENSVGVVRCLSDYNNCKPGEPDHDPAKVGPELDVYWEPDNLRYGYHPDDLEKVDAP